jgi:hypothetical protein
VVLCRVEVPQKNLRLGGGEGGGVGL